MSHADSYGLIDRPVEGKFLARLNRFACRVLLDGAPTKVYLPNSGRLEELLVAGARVMLEKRRQGGKTEHDLLLVETTGFPEQEPIWAGLDSRLPPRLIAWAIERGLIEPFANAQVAANEPQMNGGRLDLLLRSGKGDIYVEAKSVNLVDREGTARFPDAPTERGRRHLETLSDLSRSGVGAAVVFVIMREDAELFAPFVERDREFAEALTRAAASGVQLTAFQFRAGATMEPIGSLPIVTSPPAFPGYWPPAGEVGES